MTDQSTQAVITRALYVGVVMGAFGPEFEHAAEQLADRVMKVQRELCCELVVEHRELYQELLSEGRREIDNIPERLSRIHRLVVRAINASVGHTLALVKDARLKGSEE